MGDEGWELGDVGWELGDQGWELGDVGWKLGDEGWELRDEGWELRDEVVGAGSGRYNSLGRWEQGGWEMGNTDHRSIGFLYYYFPICLVLMDFHHTT